MKKIYLVFSLCFILMSFSTDCKVAFSCKETKDINTGLYNLEITMQEGPSEVYTFQLVDLNTGNTIKTEKKEFSENTTYVVFSKIGPSTYAVYYSSESCQDKKAIPGKGIILE